MRAARNLLIYAAVVACFGAGIVGILRIGPAAPAHTGSPGAASGAPPRSAGTTSSADVDGALGRLLHNAREPLALLLLQVVVIVAVARGVGAIFVRFGQPSVVGEMVAGILLGPSLFGLLAPAAQAALFPAASLGSLRLLSQIGVIVFMFVVGIDLDIAHLRRQSHAALLVSHASILVPFLLGTAFALVAYRDFAPQGVPFNAFALFLGTAMSITAFPVLARILEERRLTKTALGATAIACAAVDDVTAWCLLALVVAIAKSTALAGAIETVVLTVVFVALLGGVVKPLAARLIRPQVTGEGQARALLAGVLAFIFLSAFATEAIGIHALFGGFLAGVVLPSYPSVREFLKARLESFSSVFLLPLFFAFTGLRTQIGLLDSASNWLFCLAVIGVATAGKVGGTTIAARVTGMTWPDAFALGALMNTRGLVELIVLNLGYDLGILSPAIFTMMVLMALTTTIATGPLLALQQRWTSRHPAPEASPSEA